MGRLQASFRLNRTDAVRARMAAGMLERIANWNGYGRVLLAIPCGLDPVGADSRTNFSATAAVMRIGQAWGMRPKLFAAERLQYDRADLDRHVTPWSESPFGLWLTTSIGTHLRHGLLTCSQCLDAVEARADGIMRRHQRAVMSVSIDTCL